MISPTQEQNRHVGATLLRTPVPTRWGSELGVLSSVLPHYVLPGAFPPPLCIRLNYVSPGAAVALSGYTSLSVGLLELQLPNLFAPPPGVSRIPAQQASEGKFWQST